MVEVRRAIASDAQALAVLAEQTFRETFASENSAADMEAHCSTNFSADIQAREIQDPGIVTLLAEVQRELAGFAQVRPESSIESVSARYPSELYRLYVSSERHGQGVAQNIMREVLSVAGSVGSDFLWLGVWEHNPKAIAFYRKYGFEVVGDHVFQLGEDSQRDLVMSVKLSD